jgi:hypothetical protein
MAFEASISPAGLRTRSTLRDLMTDIDITKGCARRHLLPDRKESTPLLRGSSPRSCYSLARSAGAAAWTGRPRPTSSTWAQNRTRSAMTLSTTEAACTEPATMVELTDIGATVTHVDGVRALVISGYDRTTTPDGQAWRVHPEDTLRHSAWTPGT